MKRAPRAAASAFAFPSSPKEICCVQQDAAANGQQVVAAAFRGEMAGCPKTTIIERDDPNHQADAGDVNEAFKPSKIQKDHGPLVETLAL